MRTLRTWAAIALLLVVGLVSGVSAAAAQEAQGDPGGGEISVVTYNCEDGARAGEVEIFVSPVSASDVGDCVLPGSGAYTFGLYDGNNTLIDSATTDTDGVAFFLGVPAGSYYVAETNTLAVTGTFEVSDGSFTAIAFVEYVSEVLQPEPTESGEGLLQVLHMICEDADQAGETDIFAGGAVLASDDSFVCEFGVGTTFTINIIVSNADVAAAGSPTFGELTTGEDGFTSTEYFSAGDYRVSKETDPSVGIDVNIPDDAFVLVTVIDYVAPVVETATLTIHKSECETGVGADIFETCHDDTVEGVTFWVNDVEWTTDKDGIAAGEVDAGVVEIAEDEATFEDYLGGYVYCSVQGTGEVLIDTDTQDGVVEITVESDDDVVCDWYNITEATAPPVDDDDDKDDEEDVTQLPATGAGISSGDSAGLALMGLIAAIGVAGVSGLRLRRN